MELNVRLFALYRERAGSNKIAIDIPEGATVADLTDEVRRQLPNLAPPEVTIVVAVNADYASHDVVLQSGDDVCLIPPVSGG
jgi:molybdopterin converting factor subunit 1